MTRIRRCGRGWRTTLAFFAAVGINVVVVHGGGKAITKAMEAAGLNASFVNGLRITTKRRWRS